FSVRGFAVSRPFLSRSVSVSVAWARAAPAPPLPPFVPAPPVPPAPPAPPAPPVDGGGGVVPPPLAPVPPLEPLEPCDPLSAGNGAGRDADTLPATSPALTSSATPCRSDGQPAVGTVAAKTAAPWLSRSPVGDSAISELPNAAVTSRTPES